MFLITCTDGLSHAAMHVPINFDILNASTEKRFYIHLI